MYVPTKCVHLNRCLYPTRFAKVVFFSFKFLLVSLRLSSNSSVSTQIPLRFFFYGQTTTSSGPSTAPGHGVSKTVAGCPRDVYNNFFFFFHPSRSAGVWREQKQTIAPGTTAAEAKDVYVLIKFLVGHEEKKLNRGLGQKTLSLKATGTIRFEKQSNFFLVSQTIKKKSA